MRKGRVFRRCSCCGARFEERRCDRCGAQKFSWAYVVDIGPLGGAREQRAKGGYKTKAQALAAMNELQGAVASGTYVEPKRLTLAAYLTGDWLPGIRGQVRAGSYDACELHVRRYIIPRIGATPLQELTRGQVKALYRELRESGRERGRGGLSPKSVHNVHLTLRKALADAVEDRLIPRNPADRGHKLPGERPEMKTWSAEQLAAFLRHVEGDELYALWRTWATSGLRRGEVIAPRWEDLDLEGGALSVNRQLVKGSGGVSFGPPKTAKGRRSVALDPKTIAALRVHRTAQVEQRLAFGQSYRDHGLVFCRLDGSPLDPDGVSQRFERHVRDSGLARIRPHDLRHTWATLALRAGVHPKVVQERLGHSSITVTLDTYTHAIPAMQAEAAELVAALLV